MTDAKAAPRDEAGRRSVNINLRVSTPVRDLIDRAAQATGKSRSEFMLDSARRSAQDVLLEHALFALDGDAHDAFLAVLDAPPPPSDRLRALMAAKAPWEA
jgi:uncharacterized protein (DUF1778 family)